MPDTIERHVRANCDEIVTAATLEFKKLRSAETEEFTYGTDDDLFALLSSGEWSPQWPDFDAARRRWETDKQIGALVRPTQEELDGVDALSAEGKL